MEPRSILKRSQSLKSVTWEKPTWTDGSLQDKRTSVSQLVAKYQVGSSQQVQTTTVIDIEEKPKEDLTMIWRSHLKANDLKQNVDNAHDSSVSWINNDTWIQSKNPPSLPRSKSMGSLHNIDALKSKFEPRFEARIEQNTFISSPRKSANSKVSNEEKGTSIEVESPMKKFATMVKQNASITKVENNTKVQRRKTIGGIDFEKLATSQAEEKRRSIADFRDSTEKLSVSVKAISALYLSKVSPQETKTLVASTELGKRTISTKMAENEGYPHKTTIGSMQQRRRKNELKRLLKHTHPEITMLDKVVDKELAAVLKSEEEEAAAETGYEGEVFSKCLIFENSTTGQKEPLYTSNMAQGTDQTPAASVFLEHSKHDEELIEEAEARIHVHSTRMLFEEQTMKATHSYQHKSQENVCNQPGNQIVNKSIPNIQTESLHKFHKLPSTDQQIEIPDEDFTFSEPESLGDTIKTSLDLFRHNPFIPVNVEKQQSSFQSTEANIPEGEVSHVKTRKHLFETMPFDKIRQQNKDDIETMVENIRETLHFLHSANVLQSKGSIIEVHETMNATKVNFTYTETGPEIMQDTVAEGGAQNFIVHLLPRVNVQPQIKYIKEDRSGALLLMDVNVPVQQKHPDTDFKTANVLQLIEDILTQDNSLRKGVLIQDDVARLSQVSVYSLYHYVDNEDIKSYYPSQQAFVEDEPEIREPTQKDIPQVRSGKIQSAIHCLQESHSEICTTPEKSDITTRGNVKLFKSCIEKGDMEYLKSLQTEVDMVTEEIPLNSSSNNTSDNTADDVEYEPVDIKRLKGLFSSDSVPAKPKPETCNYISWSSIKTEEKSKTADHDTNNKQRQEAKSVFVGSGECVRQAENVEVIGQCDEISSLQVAISQLQKATVEAKSIHDSLLELQDKHKVDQTVLESTEVTALSTDSSTIQIPDSETTTEDEEVVFEGKLQAALQALQRSNLNVARGGFEAAMIYRSSNKVSQSVKAASCETTTQQVGSHSEYNQGVVVQNIDIAGKEIASQKQLVTEKSTKPLRPKPALPPKPEHLKANPNDSQPKVQIQNEEIKLEKEPGQNNGFSSEHAHDHMETQGLVKSESRNTGKNSIDDKQEQKIDQEQPDESHVNFHEARQMFGGKKTTKIAPVKPKRVKIAENKPKEQSVTPSSTNNSEQLNEGEKVTMRGKKACKETEDERRQRLSVHMDEIMRGNIPAAMEIYDNLRKQEELENILIRVEEIEKDTSEFQPVSQEKCSACFSPVYSMERVATDKSVFHKRCFCCKHCKKKLSMLNYASLHGKLYCTFHYKQLLRTKGGEEEMEPTPQHQAPGTNN